MAISTDEIDAFHRFAIARLQQGEAESISQLAAQWSSARESEQLAADVEAARADIEAGRVTPLADCFADVRRQLGLTK